MAILLKIIFLLNMPDFCHFLPGFQKQAKKGRLFQPPWDWNDREVRFRGPGATRPTPRAHGSQEQYPGPTSPGPWSKVKRNATSFWLVGINSTTNSKYNPDLDQKPLTFPSFGPNNPDLWATEGLGLNGTQRPILPVINYASLTYPTMSPKHHWSTRVTPWPTKHYDPNLEQRPLTFPFEKVAPTPEGSYGKNGAAPDWPGYSYKTGTLPPEGKYGKTGEAPVWPNYPTDFGIQTNELAPEQYHENQYRWEPDEHITTWPDDDLYWPTRPPSTSGYDPPKPRARDLEPEQYETQPQWHPHESSTKWSDDDLYWPTRPPVTSGYEPPVPPAVQGQESPAYKRGIPAVEPSTGTGQYWPDFNAAQTFTPFQFPGWQTEPAKGQSNDGWFTDDYMYLTDEPDQWLTSPSDIDGYLKLEHGQDTWDPSEAEWMTSPSDIDGYLKLKHGQDTWEHSEAEWQTGPSDIDGYLKLEHGQDTWDPSEAKWPTSPSDIDGYLKLEHGQDTWDPSEAEWQTSPSDIDGYLKLEHGQDPWDPSEPSDIDGYLKLEHGQDTWEPSEADLFWPSRPAGYVDPFDTSDYQLTVPQDAAKPTRQPGGHGGVTRPPHGSNGATPVSQTVPLIIFGPPLKPFGPTPSGTPSHVAGNSRKTQKYHGLPPAILQGPSPANNGKSKVMGTLSGRPQPPAYGPLSQRDKKANFKTNLWSYVGVPPIGPPSNRNPEPIFGDKHVWCCYWAALGECDKNMEWMRPYCQRSCGTYGCSEHKAKFCLVQVRRECVLGENSLKLPEILKNGYHSGFLPEIIPRIPRTAVPVGKNLRKIWLNIITNQL